MRCCAGQYVPCGSREGLQVWAVVLLLGEKLHGTAARVSVLALVFTAAAVGPGASAGIQVPMTVHVSEHRASQCQCRMFALVCLFVL